MDKLRANPSDNSFKVSLRFFDVLNLSSVLNHHAPLLSFLVIIPRYTVYGQDASLSFGLPELGDSGHGLVFLHHCDSPAVRWTLISLLQSGPEPSVSECRQHDFDVLSLCSRNIHYIVSALKIALGLLALEADK